MFNEWCTIESDPGVFTELAKQIGAPSVQIEEIYNLDDDQLLTKVQPHIYGFIFLFKWTKDIEKKQALAVYDDDLFFARQVVTNACATQAILSVLLNANIPISQPLKSFYEFVKELTCEDKGLALSNSQKIRLLHNSFSRPEPFIFKDDPKNKKKADAFHFISYVPHKRSLYELDGLQPGPILVGKYEQKDGWIQLAKQDIHNRIQKYSEKQIRFNLLVVCEDLKAKATQQVHKLLREKAAILKKLQNQGKQVDTEFLQNFTEVQEAEEDNEQTLQLRLGHIDIQIEDKHHFIADQEYKAKNRQVLMSQQKDENIRRKHNYVPLMIQILKTLSKKGKLTGLIQKAKKKPIAQRY